MTAPAHHIRVWQPIGFAGLELTELDTQQRLSFRGHLNSFTVGVRLEGIRKTRYRRSETLTPPEIFNVYQPGEVLSASPASSGRYRYKSISLSPELLERILADLEQPTDQGFQMLAEDVKLNARFRRLYLDCHASFADDVGQLEQETKLLELVRQTVRWLGESTPEPLDSRREHGAVGQIKNYLHDHLNQELNLEQLSSLTRLGKGYLVEVFRNQVGLTPHQYQMSLRLAQAKQLLQTGMAGSQVALELGFTDHSHFIRAFKQQVWVTPGEYQRGLL